MNGVSGISLQERVLGVFSRTTGVDVARHLDIGLYETGLLDSLQTITLMAALSDELGVALSLGEFERDDWATPRRLIAYIEDRVRPSTVWARG